MYQKNYLMIQVPLHNPNEMMYRHLATHIFRIENGKAFRQLKFESFICTPSLILDSDKDGEIEVVINKPSAQPIVKERWYDYYDFSITESNKNIF